jgi:lipopolysaccharide heptosyltransferase II
VCSSDLNWDFEWLPVRPKAAQSVHEIAATDGAQTQWIVLLPGGRWDNKRWPVEYFAEVARKLSGLPNTKLVVVGSANEKSLGDIVAAAAPGRCLNLAGATSLDEMVEWIRLSRLTITNDTGPMHIAAAMRRPVLAIFGPTNPSNTGPYGQLGNVFQTKTLPCVPCHKSTCAYREPLACLHAVKPSEVFERARAELARSRQ